MANKRSDWAFAPIIREYLNSAITPCHQFTVRGIIFETHLCATQIATYLKCLSELRVIFRYSTRKIRPVYQLLRFVPIFSPSRLYQIYLSQQAVPHIQSRRWQRTNDLTLENLPRVIDDAENLVEQFFTGAMM
jgi:hypothetical protein